MHPGKMCDDLHQTFSLLMTWRERRAGFGWRGQVPAKFLRLDHAEVAIGRAPQVHP